MRAVLVALLFSGFVSLSYAGRADDLDFHNGELKVDSETELVLDFPSVSTQYVYGDHFRTLISLEMWRRQAWHADACIGEQFAGASLGYTLGKSGFGNFSLVGGYGFDLDDSKWDWFFGVSHRSTLLSLGKLKSFTGYDFLLSRIRSGFAYNIRANGNWKLDLVGTTKLFGSRNFAGLSLGYDIFKGKGGGSANKFEVDVGGFLGLDFDKVNKAGSGIAANIRF